MCEGQGVFSPPLGLWSDAWRYFTLIGAQHLICAPRGAKC